MMLVPRKSYNLLRFFSQKKWESNLSGGAPRGQFPSPHGVAFASTPENKCLEPVQDDREDNETEPEGEWDE